MNSRSMLYVGRYSQMSLHTILGVGTDSRDDLPLGVMILPSGILKMEKKCPGLKVRFPYWPNRPWSLVNNTLPRYAVNHPNSTYGMVRNTVILYWAIKKLEKWCQACRLSVRVLSRVKRLIQDYVHTVKIINTIFRWEVIAC